MRGILIASVGAFFIVPKSNECNEVIDPTYTPGSESEQEDLFNRRFTSKLTQPMEVWVKQGYTPHCDAQMDDLNQNNNRNIL